VNTSGGIDVGSHTNLYRATTANSKGVSTGMQATKQSDDRYFKYMEKIEANDDLPLPKFGVKNYLTGVNSANPMSVTIS
jgi:hypothetical protein